MQKLILIVAMAAFAVTSGCASKKLKPVEEQIDVKANVGNKEIGLNQEEEAVIQETVPVEDELRALTWQNYEIERKLKAEREDLIRCRTDLADPRLSGNKELETIPELEITDDLSKVQQKLGITPSGRIKVIRKEFLVDKIEKENRYKDSLESLLKVISQHQKNCERELGYIRVQHGLPSKRYQAEGFLGPEGNFIVTRASEKNLDDAFKIQSEVTRKAKRALKIEKVEDRAYEDSSAEENKDEG